MSRVSRRLHRPGDDAASLRPAMADLKIAPIHSSNDQHVAPRSAYENRPVLPPLRSLDHHSGFETSARPLTLEPPRDPQPSSYGAVRFSSSRRSSKESSHHSSQYQHSSAKHRSKTRDSVSSSSTSPSNSTSPRHSILDPRYYGHSYTHETREEDSSSVHERVWKETPPSTSSLYSPSQDPYPTPVQSIAEYSELSPETLGPPTSLLPDPKVVHYRQSNPPWILKIRQQPRAARACGFGERDRRVIDPPPVVQLDSADPCGRPLDVSEVSNSFTIVHASLWNEGGTADCTALVQPGRRPGGRLMGTLVASATVALDDRKEEGIFYAFPDLSCRSYGNYRLRFALMTIDPVSAGTGTTVPVITHVMSDVFTVYSAKDFPGMKPSTALTQALKRQGMAIPVKKGKQTKGERDDGNDDDDDDV